MHVFINTTHIKKFEKERSLNKCLQLMFSSVSHEFRTPLNAFSNALNLLEYNWKSISNIIFKDKSNRKILEQANQQNQKYFRIGMVSSTILLSLVEDILDLAKLEVGTFSLNEEPFLVRKLLEEIDFIFGFQWSQKRLSFKIETDWEVWNTVFVSDHHRIKQVLMNLISNAFKFTNKGGILLKIKNKRRFDGSVFRIINELEFSVKDTGIGIDENDIPNLFTMFSTFSKGRNKKYNTKGTGLGLFISKKIVESLKGKIRIQSKVNEGTEAVFILKLK